MNQKEQIIHYWSGEADDEISCKVEDLLDQDVDARAYFDELGELALALTEEQVPGRREGLLDEVFEAEYSRSNVSPLKILTIAASVIASGFAIAMLMNAAPSTEERELSIVEEGNNTLVPLSVRLVRDSGSFRIREGGQERHNRERRRWKNIRKPNTKI